MAKVAEGMTTVHGAEHLFGMPKCGRCGGQVVVRRPEGGKPFSQCTSCGVSPGVRKCVVDGCPGVIDASGMCRCCIERKAWVQKVAPPRQCTICKGEIKGKGNIRYCAACRPLKRLAQ